MGFKILKIGLVALCYFVSIFVVAPFLISQPDALYVYGGIVFVLLIIATIPSSGFYVGNLLRGKK